MSKHCLVLVAADSQSACAAAGQQIQSVCMLQQGSTVSSASNGTASKGAAPMDLS